MGDPSKFSNIGIFYLFHFALLLMILGEVFIFFYTTNQNKSTEKINKMDKGSKWLIMINFYVCIYISFLMVSVSVPDKIRNLILPNIFSYVGVAFMLIGIVIRLASVLTLKKAFTLSVQTANTQHLITSGIYHKVRNPSYTGSIFSLIGTAIGLRNVIALFVVFILSMICYMIRINIEEKALSIHFGEEYIDYKRHTYHLIPYIW